MAEYIFLLQSIYVVMPLVWKAVWEHSKYINNSCRQNLLWGALSVSMLTIIAYNMNVFVTVRCVENGERGPKCRTHTFIIRLDELNIND